MTARVVWSDGRLCPGDTPAVRADDSAFAEGRGCYTSARIRAGAPRFAEHHVRRLLRDGRALGLPDADASALRRALCELGRAAFGSGDGVVRLQLSRDGDGGLHVVGVPRELGADPPAWRAVTAPLHHPGPAHPGGAKLSNRLPFAIAGDAARAAGVEEALLFDASGRLVEGARSNVVFLAADGTLATPPGERGAVAGVALEVLRDRRPVRSRDVSARGLRTAAGVAVLNAVRGARPLVALDGDPLGEQSLQLAAELDALLEKD